MSENVVRTCRCLLSGTNACTVWEGAWFIYFVGGVICHVGLCFSYRCGFTYWGLLTADLENVKQLIVKDLHMTLSSAQNPRSFSLSTASHSLDAVPSM